MGPTRFFPATHRPSCFDGGEWIPPTPTNVSGREDVWIPLRAGDTVMMESTLYHAGGHARHESVSFSSSSPPVRNRPCAQGAQVPFGPVPASPASQDWHLVFPSPSALVPFRHGSQGAVRFLSSEAVPSSQDLHALCPF